MDIYFAHTRFELNFKTDKRFQIICLDVIVEINHNGAILQKDH